MQESKVNNFFKHLIKALLTTIRFVLGFFVDAVRLLASSTKTTPADDELNNSFVGASQGHPLDRSGEMATNDQDL